MWFLQNTYTMCTDQIRAITDPPSAILTVTLCWTRSKPILLSAHRCTPDEPPLLWGSSPSREFDQLIARQWEEIWKMPPHTILFSFLHAVWRWVSGCLLLGGYQVLTVMEEGQKSEDTASGLSSCSSSGWRSVVRCPNLWSPFRSPCLQSSSHSADCYKSLSKFILFFK